MSFSLNILPWWGWLLCALPLRLASWFFSSLYERARYWGHSSTTVRAWERILAVIFRVAAYLFAIVGLVGFVRWFWAFYMGVGPTAGGQNWSRIRG